MKIIRKNEAQKFEDGDVFTAYEYEIHDTEINTARIEIKGRYPQKGLMRNTRVKESVYVESGKGEVSVNGVQTSVGSRDVILFENGDKIFWDGDFVLIITCTPAWTKEQHEFLH